MLRRIGLTGVLGLLLLIVGIALLGLVDLQIAAGVALVVAGIGLLAHGLIKSMLAVFGMA